MNWVPSLPVFATVASGVLGTLATLSLACGEPPAAVTAPPPTPPLVLVRPADSQFDRATVHFSQGRYAEALTELTAALPDLTETRRERALFTIAECYRLTGREREAAGTYELFASSFPSSVFAPLAALRAGEARLREEQFPQAIPMLERAVLAQEPPVREAARFYLAIAQLRTGNPSPALPSLRELAGGNSSFATASAQELALHFEQAGEWRESLTYWQLVQKGARDPALKTEATARAGWAALQLREWRLAEQLSQEARALAPKGQWAKLATTALFYVLAQGERHKEVVALHEKSRDLFLDSARAEVLLQVARSQRALGNPIEAVRLFSLFLKQFPQDDRVPVVAYEHLLERRRLNEENLAADSAAYLAAHPTSPHAPAVAFLRAGDFMRRKLYNEAIPMWQELWRKSAEGLPRETILWELHRAHMQTGRWQEAALTAQELLTTFPEHPFLIEATVNRAVALERLNQKPEALAAWRLTRERVPLGSTWHRTALEREVVLLEQLQRRGETVEACRRLLQEAPSSSLAAFAAFTVGDAAFQDKRDAEAVPFLEQARRLDPKQWTVPATLRLAWSGYRMQQVEPTAKWVAEYEAATRGMAKAEPLPVAFYYWLGAMRNEQKRWTDAIGYWQRVLAHPQVADLAPKAWWQLALAQRHSGAHEQSVKSLEAFRTADPAAANQSLVLLALAEAQIDAALFLSARETLDRLMRQEREGEVNAQARLLLARWFAKQRNLEEAARTYATVALLFEDAVLTPRAMSGAEAAWRAAGNVQEAELWRGRLAQRYPAFQPQEEF